MHRLLYLLLSISPAEADVGNLSALYLNSNRLSSLEVILSEPLGVITFMEAINGELGRPESLRQTFLESHHNTIENQTTLTNFRELQRKIRESSGSTPTDRASTDLTQEVLKVSVTATSENEFLESVKKILTRSQYEEFVEIYLIIKPIYKDLVGNPYRRPMEQYIKKIKKEGMKWKMEERVECMAKFLRSDPSSAANSPIGVYPSTRLGGVEGQSFIGVEIMGVHPRSRDIHGDISVVAHEKFHTLFHTQTDEKWSELERWFGNNLDSQPAFLNFEESVATIAGNVWAFEKATGRKASEPWYNDPSINEYAKAIASLVRRHLDECKPMDNNFIEEVISKYEELPDSIKEADRNRLEAKASPLFN